MGKSNNYVDLSLGLIVIPNPNNGSFSITGLREYRNTTFIQIISPEGKVLAEEYFSGVDELKFNMYLIPGMYYILINGEKLNRNLKFIVH